MKTTKRLLVAATLLVAAAVGAEAQETTNITATDAKSLHEALRQAREWRRTADPRCSHGISITLKAGRYYMQEPLYLRPEDSGTKASPTIIRGEEGAVVCGDPRQRHTQLWPKEGMERLKGFDPQKRTITIATPPKEVLECVPTADQPDRQFEMVVHQRWAIAILRIKSFAVRGDSVVVSFMEPESRLEFEHPWPQPVIGGERGNSAFLLRTTELRDGIEQLVVIDGASHVKFQGITFEHTCWNRPLHKGHVTLQGGFPLVDAYKLKESPGLPWDEGLENQAWIERPVSAVSVRNASGVDFSECRFQHLGATALDYESTDGGTIKDCTFEDIGGTAIMAGSFAESPREVHRPYTDLANRCRGLHIIRNTIHDAANEDWGAVAIGCGYVRECTIRENSVSHVNYSGICIGWGWTPHDTGMTENVVEGNTVSDYARQLYDAGGIYTLSNQPGSRITHNVISQPSAAPYATNHRAFCIYLDARTDGFTISGNTTEGRTISRSEIGDNHPGPNLNFKQ